MSTQSELTHLLTSKADLSVSRIAAEPLAQPAEGEAILKVDRVAVTTNNITYAVMGDAMQYWNFFPADAEGWAHMPVWGMADVVASNAAGVEVGERFYGYYPLASHLRVTPARVSSRGFYDGAPHRATLTSAYNHYTRCATDPVYDPALESYQMILRPLIITSFFCADFLEDNKFFGGKQLLVSSASSKTAYGTAFCLAGVPGIELIGLTSEKNRAFVEELGCYHRVVTYDEIERVERAPTVYLDYAGDTGLRNKVHAHFGAALVYDCVAGSAQNNDPYHANKRDGLVGPKPTTYFAPDQIKKRNKEWGYEQVNQRFGDAQRAFYKRVSDAQKPWMEVTEHQGLEAAAKLIASLIAGKVDPRVGHIVKI